MRSRRNRRSDPAQEREAELMGYTHDDPDAPEGYWAGRWVEFKRLFLMFWRQPGEQESFIISMAILLGMVVYGLIMKLF